jgi:hypothetical protein
MFRNTLLLLFAATMLASLASAQDPPEEPLPGLGPAPMISVFPPKAAAAGVEIETMDETPVKGMPFCATVSTEHTQVFGDGNRIHTTDTSSLCRDSAGRTRREASLNLLGAAPEKTGAKMITIVDPVAGFRYVLDPQAKIARKMPMRPGLAKLGHAAGTAEKADHIMVLRTEEASGGPDVFYRNVFVTKGERADQPPPASENLGDQTIEGIHATGTRITTTIPAGKMGNEQPIVVTSERWYSPELKATVLTKHNDPWSGELKTQFTNVNAAEPDSSLFTVPSDYKVVNEKTFTVKLPPPAPPSE